MTRDCFRIGLKSGSSCALLLTVIAGGCSRSYRTPSESMYPTIRKGERLVVSGAYGKPGDVRRADVVVYRYPEEPTREFVHRIAALPGDHIQVSEGRVIINGESLPQDAGRDSNGYRIVRETNGGVQYEVAYTDSCVPGSMQMELRHGQFFVLGDNRCNSRDSRFFGSVPFDAIEGRVDVASGSGDAR